MSVQAVIPDRSLADTRKPDVSQERTISLAVENMHCGGCLRSVEKALHSVPGVLHARANLSAKRVSIRCDASQCGVEDVIEALSKAVSSGASRRCV